MQCTTSKIHHVLGQVACNYHVGVQQRIETNALLAWHHVSYLVLTSSLGQQVGGRYNIRTLVSEVRAEQLQRTLVIYAIDTLGLTMTRLNAAGSLWP